MRPKVGLALGGGFARGIAHVGVLQALTAAQIPIDFVAGTSAGSLVGAMFCAGLDPWMVEQVASQVNWRALVRLKLRRDGLLDADGLERWVLSTVGDMQFEEMRVPFVATATDLTTGEGVLLSTGRVATAVRASCAFPGIFLPVRMGKHTLVDGGLTYPVPASVARKMGADIVIAVELNKPRDEIKPPRNLLHIMLYSLALVQRPHIAVALQEADVVVRPDLNDFGIIELEKVTDLIRAGRQATEQMIPDIRATIEERLTETQVAADSEE